MALLKEGFLHLIGNYSHDEAYNSHCWEEIEVQYSSKNRHYHNLEHLSNMLEELKTVKSHVVDMNALLFSIYYHDIIYKASKSDNEHQSALLLEQRLSNTSFDSLEKCMKQIEATKSHEFSSDNDTNILLDLDLSILGKPIEDYQRYTVNIRKEYKMYPDLLYRKGRKKVLKQFLERDFIYKTEFFRNQYELKARENIHNELNTL